MTERLTGGEPTGAPRRDGAEEPAGELRLTPGQWHSLLEKRSFLERDDNSSIPPRRFLGRPVRIVPDKGWR